MSYILQNHQTVKLHRELLPQSIVVVQSETFNHTVAAGPSVIEFLSHSGNVLLHIALRPHENTIRFDHRYFNASWVRRETIDFYDAGFQQNKPVTTIMVLDHGDKYQVFFDYNPAAFYYKKGIFHENIVAVRYNGDQDYHSQAHRVFGDNLRVSTYDSMRELMHDAAPLQGPKPVSRKVEESRPDMIRARL
ncbi:hypothetical protein FA15DRAFT_675404 [Coprinopsis marcescibilis]|uniref:Galectin n=1 Tax=Coprinopsis marcescibilis TaxID=230819 RepID=A0A5C3KDZ6_COPMA|nr:hypothetical protein FA15DRAFT_675404 [Coprinopsis marcescibilis]